MAREIGSWTTSGDAKRPSPSHKPSPGKRPIGQSPSGAFSAKQEARIAKALEPGETIVQRIPLSGLAVDSFNVSIWLLVAVVCLIAVPLSLVGSSEEFWLVAPIAFIWPLIILLGIWHSFTLPSRQAAVLTDRRVLIVSFGQAISARHPHLLPLHHGWRQPDLGIKKLLVRGSPARGNLCLGQLNIRRRGHRKSTTYPPFTLFGVDRPLDLAARIKQTLNLDLPITDKTGTDKTR